MRGFTCLFLFPFSTACYFLLFFSFVLLLLALQLRPCSPSFNNAQLSVDRRCCCCCWPCCHHQTQQLWQHSKIFPRLMVGGGVGADVMLPPLHTLSFVCMWGVVFATPFLPFSKASQEFTKPESVTLLPSLSLFARLAVAIFAAFRSFALPLSLTLTHTPVSLYRFPARVLVPTHQMCTRRCNSEHVHGSRCILCVCVYVCVCVWGTRLSPRRSKGVFVLRPTRAPLSLAHSLARSVRLAKRPRRTHTRAAWFRPEAQRDRTG